MTTHIVNEGAYQNAIANRIKENAVKGKRARWFKEDPSREALIKQLSDLIHINEGRLVETDIKGDLDRVCAETNRSAAYIEKHYNFYSDTTTVNDENDKGFWDYKGKWVREKDKTWTFWKWQQPAKKRVFVSTFFIKLEEAFDKWGSLTENQEKALRKALAEKETKDAEHVAKRQAEHAKVVATSNYVGKIKERRDFDLTITKTFQFESDFGTLNINICADAEGNVIVYKGNTLLGDRGQTIKVKATVKDHSERDGVKQTIINRPKVL